MDWIAHNLSWLVPTVITVLGGGIALALNYPETFPKKVGLPLFVWIALIWAVIAIWTTVEAWMASRSLVECIANPICDKDKVASLAKDIDFYLTVLFAAYFVTTVLFVYVYLLVTLPRKLAGK
jgi:hypothetical protein